MGGPTPGVRGWTDITRETFRGHLRSRAGFVRFRDTSDTWDSRYIILILALHIMLVIHYF